MLFSNGLYYSAQNKQPTNEIGGLIYMHTMVQNLQHVVILKKPDFSIMMTFNNRQKMRITSNTPRDNPTVRPTSSALSLDGGS